MNESNPINCTRCVHYYVTWDPANPKGCRYFGFKTRMVPSQYVLKSSGSPCHAYTPKK